MLVAEGEIVSRRLEHDATARCDAGSAARVEDDCFHLIARCQNGGANQAQRQRALHGADAREVGGGVRRAREHEESLDADGPGAVGDDESVGQRKSEIGSRRTHGGDQVQRLVGRVARVHAARDRKDAIVLEMLQRAPKRLLGKQEVR